MITLKKEADLLYMRIAGKIVADVLDMIAAMVRPGISTGHIDEAAEELIRAAGATPAFKGYTVPGISSPFPAAVCASVNEEIVHGIPSRKRILLEGDIPSPINPPSGCSFHPRCPRARDLCSERSPEFLVSKEEDDHFVACHFPLENGCMLGKERFY